MNALDYRIPKWKHPTTDMITAAAEPQSANLTLVPAKQTLRLLSCAPVNGSATLPPYSVYLSHLLGGRLSYFALPEKDTVTAVQNAARQQDLIVLDEPEQSLVTRLCLGPPGSKFAACLPVSVLVARQPLWPLRRLLLILRLDDGDETAVFWTKRLAQASEATVTILPLVPALPALYAPRPTSVQTLLSSQTAVGQQLRQISRQFYDDNVTAMLHLRQGEPGEQIRCEIETGLYDLIVLGTEPEAKWQRWLLGNLVAPLLTWINHPVLVAKPSLRLVANVKR